VRVVKVGAHERLGDIRGSDHLPDAAIRRMPTSTVAALNTGRIAGLTEPRPLCGLGCPRTRLPRVDVHQDRRSESPAPQPQPAGSSAITRPLSSDQHWPTTWIPAVIITYQAAGCAHGPDGLASDWRMLTTRQHWSSGGDRAASPAGVGGKSRRASCTPCEGAIRRCAD
jgi:hypothetical protein